MNSATLVLFLIALGRSHFLVFSDPGTTTVQYPANSTTILQTNSSVFNANPLRFNGPNWIWSNGTTKITVFETMFYSPFAGEAYFQVITNNTHYSYLNGVSLKSGTNTSDFISCQASCGLNNITVRVENTGLSQPSGVAYFLQVIDKSDICNGNNGFYDYSSCGCLCSASITCDSNKLKLGYPNCGCKCPNEGFVSCNLNGQYYDKTSCSCQCFKRYCKLNFEQDPNACNCRCKATTCTSGTWNYSQCKCV